MDRGKLIFGCHTLKVSTFDALKTKASYIGTG